MIKAESMASSSTADEEEFGGNDVHKSEETTIKFENKNDCNWVVIFLFLIVAALFSALVAFFVKALIDG